MMSLRRFLLSSCMLLAAGAVAAERPAERSDRPDKSEKMDKPDKPADAHPEKKEEKEPPLSITEHTMTIGGRTLHYQATAGYLPLKDAKGEKTKANIFFVAYTKLAAEGDAVDLARRPVTYSFNGGPGSASIWLHMGALGPKRVAMTAK